VLPAGEGLDLLDRPGLDTALARRLHQRGVLELKGLIEVLNRCRRGDLPTLARAMVEEQRLDAEQVRGLLREVLGATSDSGSLNVVDSRENHTQQVAPAVSGSVELEGDPWVAGSDVGPYRLLERVGLGGMGIVFRAQHRETGEVVALKTFRLDADPELRLRFRRELEAQQRLVHPNLVPSSTAECTRGGRGS